MKIRLQRFLADCGVASRRDCEQMILSGRVHVNGEVKTTMPVMIEPGVDVITVDNAEVGEGGQPLQEQTKVYLLLNKPKGILVTNYDPANRKTVGELLKGIAQRVFPVGRLDMDARGALIMTNDGELANRLTHPRFGVEKTYIVEVDGRVNHEDLEKIKRGVWLGPTAPAAVRAAAAAKREGPPNRAFAATKSERFKVSILGRERGRTILEIKSSEGKNREIPRVMARIGHVVRDMNRVAIGGKVTIKGLDVGEFRPLTAGEVQWLFRASSPEFHATQRQSTQAWYEAKELEKERKRLQSQQARDESLAAAKPAKQAPVTPVTPFEEDETYRARPERKGKKPFVPPTGRNAGKPIGGNYLGRIRLEREAAEREEAEQNVEQDFTPVEPEFEHEPEAPKVKAKAKSKLKSKAKPNSKSEDLPSHPLGESAASDE